MDNRKNVLIKLTGVHAYDGEKSEKTISTYKGSWTKNEASNEIRYKDDEQMNAIIKISEDCIELNRSGEYRTTMLFDIKKEYCTRYRTPFGYMNMNIKTTNLDISMMENSITADVEYILGSDGRDISQAYVHIEISSQE